MLDGDHLNYSALVKQLEPFFKSGWECIPAKSLNLEEKPSNPLNCEAYKKIFKNRSFLVKVQRLQIPLRDFNPHGMNMHGASKWVVEARSYFKEGEMQKVNISPTYSFNSYFEALGNVIGLMTGFETIGYENKNEIYPILVTPEFLRGSL